MPLRGCAGGGWEVAVASSKQCVLCSAPLPEPAADGNSDLCADCAYLYYLFGPLALLGLVRLLPPVRVRFPLPAPRGPQRRRVWRRARS